MVPSASSTSYKLGKLWTADPSQLFDVAHIGVVRTERKADRVEVGFLTASGHVVCLRLFNLILVNLKKKSMVIYSLNNLSKNSSANVSEN